MCTVKEKGDSHERVKNPSLPIGKVCVLCCVVVLAVSFNVVLCTRDGKNSKKTPSYAPGPHPHQGSCLEHWDLAFDYLNEIS